MKCLQMVKPLLQTAKLSNNIINLIENISNNTYKGSKKMEDNQLYYEVKGITRTTEIEAAYKHAVECNYKYYRAVSEKGAFFGWVDGKHIKAAEGQEWFINSSYIPVQSEENSKEPSMDMTFETVEQLNNEISISTKEDTIKAEESHDEPDYKSLYEEAAIERDQYKVELLTVVKELREIKSAIFTLVKEFKEADDKLKE